MLVSGRVLHMIPCSRFTTWMLRPLQGLNTKVGAHASLPAVLRRWSDSIWQHKTRSSNPGWPWFLYSASILIRDRARCIKDNENIWEPNLLIMTFPGFLKCLIDIFRLKEIFSKTSTTSGWTGAPPVVIHLGRSCFSAVAKPKVQWKKYHDT